MPRGYVQVRHESAADIGAVAKIFVHEATGAPVLFLETRDDNKVFAAAFRTPPHDDTGLPHILEHSVLNGSRRFPLKEPFVALAKGSLNTFLNAMTYPDKTVYPVASRVAKDLFNLMDVYLDGVFFPRLLEDPTILMQEGWHLHVEDGEPHIRGVVYNEMKGAYSQPEARLSRALERALYPDTVYRFDSGGDPDAIPGLTQEAFVRYHEEHYHPGNALFLVYGDLVAEEVLEFLEDRALRHFSRKSPTPLPPLQPPFSTPRVVLEAYPLPEGEEKGETYAAWGSVLGEEARDTLWVFALEILAYALVNRPAAPLRQALLGTGLVKDVYAYVEADVRQPYFALVGKGIPDGQAFAFFAAARDAVERLVREEIPLGLLHAALTRKLFELREADTGSYPKGLVYLLEALRSWRYDGDPLEPLNFSAVLEDIRVRIPTGLFTDLLARLYLRGTHQALVVLEPKPGLAQAKEAALASVLRHSFASLSPSAQEELRQRTAQLLEKQRTPDPPEAKALLPRLALHDVPRSAPKVPTEVVREGEQVHLLHPIPTQRIAYVSLYVSLAPLAPEDLFYAGLLTSLLGRMPTDAHDAETLAELLDRHTGGVNASIAVYERAEGKPELRLALRGRALAEELPRLAGLMEEIATGTRVLAFPQFAERLRERLARLESDLVPRGHLVASQRLLAQMSPAAAVLERTGGVEHLLWLRELLERGEEALAEAARETERVYRLLFRAPAVVSFTADPDLLDAARASFAPFLASLPKRELAEGVLPALLPAADEALLSAADVFYVAKGLDLSPLGYVHRGSVYVLEQLLRLEYLWNRVRVEGGAYGAFVRIDRLGRLVMSSYRDPHLEETIRVYDEAVSFLRKVDLGREDMHDLILGTIARLDQPLSPSLQGERGDAEYFSGITPEELDARRAEVLAAKPEDLREYAPYLEVFAREGRVVALGPKDALAAHGRFVRHTSLLPGVRSF
ncbi:MAG: hypothetical protein BLITH_0445 [Brockia lithotrophica]|uniref:Peptidase M16C associated domain-containing protein n=1 Tax=Brockia lithotrophica TaxID=933949 RepID=A0A2T5GB01_9BACL|nr:MAG: hypothetical protein BLITH_0445 [Brockia lithotrophica]